MSSVQSTANVSAASIGLRISLWVGQVLLMGMFLMAGSADPGPLILQLWAHPSELGLV